MAVPLLQLSGIGKSFGRNRVLDDVSLDLEAGEIHILAGENGAGKSTLIKILGGVYAEFEGQIVIEDESVCFASPQDASRHGIAVIHQEMSLIESMSVADNILLGREAVCFGGCGLDRRANFQKAAELCQELDLQLSDRDLSRPVEEFSLSVRNRIEIAKALAGDARILVMDEPTSALNLAEVEKLIRLIRKLQRRGCGIIYISHKMEEIYSLADRITALRDGRRIGTANAVDCPESQLIRWMIGRELTAASERAERMRSEGIPRLNIRGFCVPSESPGQADVVRDFSIEAEPGEIIGIFGLQGSGATELFQGLFGSHGSCSGTVSIDGTPFTPRSPIESIARGLSYLTADRKGSGLVIGLSVEANINLASMPGISPWGVRRHGLEQACAHRNVDALQIRLESIDQEVGTLSGGNQQKVVLAKWLETRPKVLLLEEPTRGVDIGAKHEIYRLLRQCAANGLTILLISTDMPELLSLSDHVMVLHRGTITARLDRKSATPERLLAAAMRANDENLASP